MKNASRRLLFILAYCSYAAIYIARLNLTVASPVLQSEQILSSTQIGMMGGAFFLFYSAGQLLNGYLGDVFPPRGMVMTGLLCAAGANLCIGFLPGAGAIILLWAVNGFAQSMLWGPLLRTIAGQYPAGRKSFVASFLVSSVGVGSVIGIFLATAAIQAWDVRYAFFLPGMVSLLAFAAVALLFRFNPAASYFMKTFSVDLVSMPFYVFAIPFLGLVGRLAYPPLYRLFQEREHSVSIFALALTAVSLVPLCF